MIGKDMLADIEKVLISEDELKSVVENMGKQISEDYKDKDLLLVSVLKGSVIFMADLMRAITVPCNIDFMAVSIEIPGKPQADVAPAIDLIGISVAKVIIPSGENFLATSVTPSISIVLTLKYSSANGIPTALGS